MSGPFDAVIAVLLSSVSYKTDDEKERMHQLWPTYRNSMGYEHEGNVRSAIRVLTAAGKIEAPSVLVQVMADLTVILARDGRTVFVKWMRDVVLPLLDAFPDPATEKEKEKA